MTELTELTQPVETPAEPPLQFSLRSLLLLQLAVAIFCGLMVMIGIFAVLVLCIATALAAIIHVRPENRTLQRACIDLLYGIVLPILCFIFDPGFLREYGPLGSARGWSELLYTALSLQLVAFLAWQVAGRWMHWSCVAILAGVLWVGVGIASIVGLVLLPVSLFGLIAFGIGALGFTPLLTAVVFGRNAARATRRMKRVDGGVALVLLGIVLAIVIPLLIYPLVGPAILWALKSILISNKPFGRLFA